MAVAQLAGKHGISAATYYHWKSKYAGTGVPELKRLRELEAENAKPKRMYADLALENTAIKGRSQPKTLTPSAKREAIRIMTAEHRLPIIRACG